MHEFDSRPGAAVNERRLAWMAGSAVVTLALAFAVAAGLRQAPAERSADAATASLPVASQLRNQGAKSAAQYLQFEPNQGQAAKAVRYLSRGPRHSIEVFDDGIALSAQRSADPGVRPTSPRVETEPARAQLRFLGASGQGRFEAREPAAGHANYLTGGDSSKWIRDVPRYRQLRYADLYPDIDLVYYSRDGELEFDLVVKPGADPSRIRLHVGSAAAPVIAANGDLLLDGANGALRLHRPVLYQNIDGEKKVLDAKYVLGADRALGFALPAYDKRYPLIIDPVFKLLYSTYLTGFHDEQVGGMAIDAQSNAYVVGQTNSDDFVVSGNAYQRGKSTTGLQYNAVVTKFDASGTLIYSTYVGGTGSDIGAAIAVDAAGNAYITGNTTSRDFPVTAGAQQATFTGALSAYLAVLSPDGSTLAHSTFYGGSGTVQAGSIALDANGAVLLSGSAGPGLVTTAGAYKTALATGTAAFVAKFSAIAGGAPRLLAASYFGIDSPQANSTTQGNSAYSMALDAGGAPWITGQAFTTNLPVTAGAVQAAPASLSPSCAPGPGPLNSFAFVAKLSADLTSLAYASYLSGATEPVGGAACSEFGRAIALDAAGNVYVTGGTASAAFATTTGAVQPAFPAGTGLASFTGFVTKLKADGSAVLWSTYLGGNGGNTFPAAIAMDPGANAVWTTSVTGGGSNYPITTDALQKVHGGGGADAGIVQLDATTGALKYSTFLGGSSADVGLALGVDSGGNAFVAGNTFSPNFPLTANAYEKAFRPDFFGGADWFFSVLGSATVGSVLPTRAGNNGDVSVAIRGAGLVSGSTCRLEGSVTIDSIASNVAPDGTSLGCTFALDGKPVGDYVVVVTALDGTRVRARQPLTIEAGSIASAVWANIVGRPKIRAGVPATYEISYGNRGNVNAYGVTLAISWPTGVSVKRLFEFKDLPAVPVVDANASVPEAVEKDGRMYTLVFLPMVPAGRTFTLPIEVTAPLSAADFRVAVSLSRPLANSLAALQEAFATTLASGSRENALSIRAQPLLTDGQSCVLGAVNAVVSLVQALPPGRCVAAAAGLVLSAAQTVASNDNGNASSSGNAFNMGQLLLNMGQTALSCAIAANPVTAGAATVLGGINFLISAAAAADACGPTIGAAAIQIAAAAGIDPNDKSGPSGDGSARHFVAGSTPSAYQIAFENLPTAGLPAANVVVTDRLDTTRFDLSTLTLGDIGWGSVRIDVPPGLNSFATVRNIDATLSVRVQGSLDPTTGVLKWTFTSLDPATGLPPSDPTLGFLPPDTDGVKGQGHVNFVVRPKAGLTAGTEISNTASIVFDANPPILTPTWLHTLDTVAPTSRVQSLTGRPGTLAFDVAWDSAADSGSAGRSYTVYASDNGNPFSVWQSAVNSKSAVYTGVSGHSYSFYVIATDGAGNVEAAKTTAEATIAVSGAFADPTVGTSGSGGGGCTIGGDGRDVSMPLWVLVAAAGLAFVRRRRHAPARSHEAA